MVKIVSKNDKSHHCRSDHVFCSGCKYYSSFESNLITVYFDMIYQQNIKIVHYIRSHCLCTHQSNTFFENCGDAKHHNLIFSNQTAIANNMGCLSSLLFHLYFSGFKWRCEGNLHNSCSPLPSCLLYCTCSCCFCWYRFESN